MKNQTTTIKQKIIIPAATTDEIYEAFTDPKKHSVITGSKATGQPKIGGKFTAWDGYIWGKYLELEEGKRIVQEWKSADWPEGFGPSRFELTFKATAEGTEISMVQLDIPAGQKEELLEGWAEFYWKPLKEYFSNKKKAFT